MMERNPSASAAESPSADDTDVAVVIAEAAPGSPTASVATGSLSLRKLKRPQTEPGMGMTPADVAVARAPSLVKRKSLMGRRLSARHGSVGSPASASMRLPQLSPEIPKLVRQRYWLASDNHISCMLIWIVLKSC